MRNITKSTQFNIKSQSGQAVLFIIVSMTIALAVVANLSTRTISSLSRTTRTDTSSRVLAAAEGGAERFLSLGNSILTDISGGASNTTCAEAGATYDSANDACLVAFNSENDPIVSEAFVTVSTFALNMTTPDRYEFDVPRNTVKEVNLTRYNGNVKFCWKTTSSFSQGGSTYKDSDIYYTAYGIGNLDNTVNVSTAVASTCSNCFPSGYEDSRAGYANASSGQDGYTNCYTTGNLNGFPTKLKGIRFRSLMNDSKVAVYDVSGGLPGQGFKITSIGKLSQSQAVTASKTVVVYKSLPYLPGAFDFGILSQ